VHRLVVLRAVAGHGAEALRACANMVGVPAGYEALLMTADVAARLPAAVLEASTTYPIDGTAYAVVAVAPAAQEGTRPSPLAVFFVSALV
jgi:hypothetical protein